jgi:hypothetical protein
MLFSEPPMKLGETLAGTVTNDGVTTLINSDKLGMIYWHPCPTSVDAGPRASGRPIKAILLRNTSGTVLHGKRLGQLVAGEGSMLCNTVAGYTVDTTATKVVIIDSYLTGTVADDDIFWGILEGPCVGRMQTLANASSVVAPGAFLVAGSGAGTATNTTSGGLAMTTAPVVHNIVGVGLTNVSTSSAGGDVALNACIQVF